jgi:predicted nucleic acid-binding protein
MVESGNVLAKKVRASEMTGSEAIDALALIGLSVTRLVPTLPLIQRALDLSIALSHPIYDCVFLACAEQEKGRLVTRDTPFIKRVMERGYGHLLEPAP